MTDEEFFQWLQGLSDDELATQLEKGGTVFAPNPHVVLEAAKRLRAKEKIGRYKMNEETIAVELTESEIYMVKALAVLARVLSKVQNGDRSCRALHKEIEMKMLKALDAIRAKKAELVK